MDLSVQYLKSIKNYILNEKCQALAYALSMHEIKLGLDDLDVFINRNKTTAAR
ncbi:hypothetical protein ACJX0J_036643, partial [Zea mays]